MEPLLIDAVLKPNEEYELVYNFEIPLSYDEKFFTLNLILIDPLKNHRFGESLIAIIELVNFHD